MPKYSWNLQILSIIEKFKSWKVLLKKVWKIGKPFSRWNWKIGTPMPRWIPSWIIGKPLARWHVKMRSWHALGTLARRPLAHMARMTRDLPNSHMLCESVNVNMKTTINFYLVIKEKFEYIWVIGPYFVWVAVSKALFWVNADYFWGGGGSGGVWGIILGRWGWVGVYGALFWVEGLSGVGGALYWGLWVTGGDWGWVHCLIMFISFWFHKES